MGYRSEVRMVIKAEKIEHLFYMQEFLEYGTPSHDSFTLEYTKDENKNCFYGLINSYCKFYESYASVKRIIKLIDRFETLNCNENYLFLRVGEDYGDVYSSGELDINMHINAGVFDDDAYEEAKQFNDTIEEDDYYFDCIEDNFSKYHTWYSKEEAEKKYV